MSSILDAVKPPPIQLSNSFTKNSSLHFLMKFPFSNNKTLIYSKLALILNNTGMSG